MSVTPRHYVIQGGRICLRKQTRDGVVVVPLANFSARLVEEVLLDNGAETTRAFVVEGTLADGTPLPRVQVAAQRFGTLAWISELWGARPIVRAGTTVREYLREAIQENSPGIRTRQVFTHTGWREISGRHVYLTAAGAVGPSGVEVDLDAGLARYSLPVKAENPAEAFRASLRLLDTAPHTVTVPLWAAVYRAPLASVLPVDLSLWLEGTTGSLKSTLAALFLSHFGDFDRLHLPGSWVSTANALERQAFLLKDTVFVVDDYAPRSGLDDRELQAKAARLLRAQGNLAGRGRLRQDTSERPAMPPRGLILATGEQHPPGQSVLARTVMLELERDGIDFPSLDRAQAEAGQLTHAMTGYVEWLGPQMPGLPKQLEERFVTVRAHASTAGVHLRVPEAVAHLWIGVEMVLEYGQAIGAIGPRVAEAYREPMWDALNTVASGQGRLVAEERPTLRFLRLLATLVMQGRVLLADRDAGMATTSGRADFIGWYDDVRLYLVPEAAYTAVTRYAREAGSPFPIAEERLRRELAKEGLSEHDPGRLTKTVKIGGDARKLLTLVRASVEDALGESFPVVPTVTGVGE
jgi:hypothetical protein